MFDFDISLFIITMWITIICYFDCSHVKHVDYYYKLFYFQSGRWWLYRIQSGNTEWIVTHEVPRKERAGDSICRDLVMEKTSEWKKLAKLAGWSPMDLPAKWHFFGIQIRHEISVSRKCLGYVINVTFWVLLPALLIDSMRLREGFLWNS